MVLDTKTHNYFRKELTEAIVGEYKQPVLKQKGR